MQVRYNDATRTEAGYVDAVDQLAGQATRGRCEDQGPDVGVRFPADAEVVDAWSLDNATVDSVIATKSTSGDRWQVWTSDQLSTSARQHVLARIGVAR